MLKMWVQANAYAKFIMILFFVNPICMMYIAYKFEKMFPEETEKAQIGGNRVRA